MFTAKQFSDKVREGSKELEDRIDDWLEDTVAPQFTGDCSFGTKVDVPHWIGLEELRERLRTRGFDTMARYNEYTTDTIYIKLPRG